MPPGGGIVEHPVSQRRHRIDQGRHEHVAGDAADGVQVDVAEGHAASTTGTT